MKTMNILPYNRAASDTAEAHPSPKAPTNSNGIDQEGNNKQALHANYMNNKNSLLLRLLILQE